MIPKLKRMWLLSDERKEIELNKIELLGKEQSKKNIFRNLVSNPRRGFKRSFIKKSSKYYGFYSF
jgi:hypothetical protein